MHQNIKVNAERLSRCTCSLLCLLIAKRGKDIKQLPLYLPLFQNDNAIVKLATYFSSQVHNKESETFWRYGYKFLPRHTVKTDMGTN